MARNKQKLINYHSLSYNSARTDFNVANLDYGEIAVRNNVQQPELYIKTGENTYAVFLASGETQRLITEAVQGVNTNFTEFQTEVQKFSAYVESDYSTTAYTTGATANAYTLATAYTKAVSADIESNFEKYATSAVTHQTIESVKSIATQNTADIIYVSGQVTNLSAGTIALIKDKLSNVYVYRGSVPEYANLSAFTATAVAGDVYNVVAQQGNPGSADYVPAGTNYAFDGENWDALGGTVDLSNYTTTATTHDLQQQVTGIDTNLGQLSAGVISEYATTAYTTGATANAYTLATTYADSVSGDIESNFEKYATSADTEATINSVKSSVSNIETGLGNLSGHVENYTDPLVESALQGFALTGLSATTLTGNQTKQSGAIADFTSGGTATLDLSELIIDCGDF